MEPNSLLPTEVFLSDRRSSLGTLPLEGNPQPGSYLDIAGQAYLVLERRHRYHLKSGQYHLHKIALYVQAIQAPTEKHLWDGRWVMGDPACVYNARSELLRCAVNPMGPCDRCTHYEPAL